MKKGTTNSVILKKLKILKLSRWSVMTLAIKTTEWEYLFDSMRSNF